MYGFPIWNLQGTKGIIRNRKSKIRHHNGQTKKDKRTKNSLQNITQKTKDRATRIPLNIGGQTGEAVYVTAKRQEQHMIWKWCLTPVYVTKYK